MLHIDALIPAKRLIELNVAYKDLKALGCDESALSQAYNELEEKLSSRISSLEDGGDKTLLDIVLPHSEELSSSGVGITGINPGNFEFSSEDVHRESLERFIQLQLFQLLSNNKKGDIFLRLFDCQNAGFSYGSLAGVAASDKELYGGKVFCSEQDIQKQLSEIDQIIQKNVQRIAGISDNVFAYNRDRQNGQGCIPVLVVVVFDEAAMPQNSLVKLHTLESNAEKGGVIIIKAFPDTEQYKKSSGYSMSSTPLVEIDPSKKWKVMVAPEQVVFSRNDFSIECSWTGKAITQETAEVLTKKVAVDTLADHHIILDQTELFAMDQTKRLMIPFAIDSDNRIVCMELGGKAPAHAMISGGTGSGKSVLLHSIIESLCLNYHPNDVEIWAIDYKAVEFAGYAEFRTPHITVVGQDNSLDFSYSLIDLVRKEYERRKQLFVEHQVKNLEDYRKKGFILSRLVIIIDEFHNLTQAVKQSDYYTNTMENLLSEMRAAGMSFIFCSQSVSNGLQGLTQKGRDQIGCRLCMKQDNADETRETLADSFASAMPHIEKVKNFATGQVLYKKRLDGGGYDYEYLHVLFYNDDMRHQIIEKVNEKLGDNYEHRHEIICKNSERYDISEKTYHCMNGFIEGVEAPKAKDGIILYPGAPTNLEDAFSINLERTPGSNLLSCISDENMLHSNAFFMTAGLLMRPENEVHVSIIDENNGSCIEIKEVLEQLCAPNLHLHVGGKEAFRHIMSLEKLKPAGKKNQIQIFYGLNRIKSVLFMLENEDQDDNEVNDSADAGNDQISNADMHETESNTAAGKIEITGNSMAEQMASMQELLAGLESGFGMDLFTEVVSTEQTDSANESDRNVNESSVKKETFTEKELIITLKKLFEYGPDLGYFNILLLDNAKQFKQSGINSLEQFEYRIGSKMSSEDSYQLFGSEYFVNKLDHKTLAIYEGSNKNSRSIRPYLLPTKEWIRRLKEKFQISE